MGKSNKFSPALREGAVRMVQRITFPINPGNPA